MKKNLQTAAEVKNEKPTASNNTTTLVIAKTNEPELKVKETEKPVEVADAKRIGEPKSVKDILEKHAKIAKCIEKRASIDEASKTLDSFNLGTSRIKDTLTIEDGNGNTFETSKTDLIEDVINLLKQRVEIKTAEVEAELLQLEAA